MIWKQVTTNKLGNIAPPTSTPNVSYKEVNKKRSI